ncbi:unnamed protein product [Chironomus riparius]|uniref:G-protein coupled receptors family 3 profile domain-containing protein n=1 Tax=Chironomus riparius TaxID=315576 RepID=A0A9N9RYK7_9DIPT|nr:unnamed protein product [Chironomus riparius]
MSLKLLYMIGFINTFLQIYGIENYEGLANVTESNQTNLESISTTNYATNPYYSQTVTQLHLVNTTEFDYNSATTSFDINCFESTNHEHYNVETHFGNIFVSFILQECDNATNTVQFIAKRINELNLLAHNTSIGVRIINIIKPVNFSEILEDELDYLEHCTDNPFGIFISQPLWHHISESDKNYELKMWPLPDIASIKMHKVAHLLNELPLNIERNAVSVEVKSNSIKRTKEFEMILKLENLCFKSFPSNDNIFIHVGDEDYFKSVRILANQSHVMIPLAPENTNIRISEIPVKVYFVQEQEVQINDLEQTYPSTFISIGTTFLEIIKTINKALSKFNNASTTVDKSSLKKYEIYNDLEVFGNISHENPENVLNILKLNTLKAQMNYILYQRSSNGSNELVISNYITNLTTVFIQDQNGRIPLGSLFKCFNTSKAFNSSLSNESENESHHLNSFNPNEVFTPETFDSDINIDGDMQQLYWELKTELWVAIGLTMSTLGILLSMAILTFIIIRICMDDVLEGNPIGSVVMLIALIAQFTSFFPFTIEYESGDLVENDNVMNSMCIIKLFLVSVSYCLTFSLLLSRAIMLASIGSEGGFLSHVNGYIQSILCFFSFIVQLGLSVQLLIVMHANSKNVTCINIYNGNWFWAVIGYDGFILILLLSLAPFIFKSQRNYHEGILIVITTILCILCWFIWIPLSMIDHNFREIMISLGVQSTAWIILVTIMVPRCFLIVKSIARSDFTQALPSLTSLAFAQANHFISEPSIYECVNPTMRSRSIGEESDQTNLPNESYMSPSEVPTLPLRCGRRSMEYNLNFNEIINPNLLSPNKMTRF